MKYQFSKSFRHGFALSRKQVDVPWTERDYSYIEFHRKAFDYEKNPVKKENWLLALIDAECRRDYHTGSLKQIRHAIQFDRKANSDFTEPKLEIYKLSVAFQPICKKIFTKF